MRAHTLKVEAGLWQGRNFVCNHCDCQDIQDEKHVLFFCKDARVCTLRQKYCQHLLDAVRSRQPINVKQFELTLREHIIKELERP